MKKEFFHKYLFFNNLRNFIKIYEKFLIEDIKKYLTFAKVFL